MVMPDVTDTGLHWKRNMGERFQLTDRPRQKSRYRREEVASQWRKLWPTRDIDRLGQLASAANGKFTKPRQPARDSRRRARNICRCTYWKVTHGQVKLCKCSHRRAQLLRAGRQFIVGLPR